MREWIHSRIYIRGNEMARNEITQAKFNFEELAPCPEGAEPDLWQKNVYGTQFEGEPEIINDDKMGQICVVTKTALSPPILFCKWLMNHYNELWIKIIYEGKDSKYADIIILQKYGDKILTEYISWTEPYSEYISWNEPYYDAEKKKLCFSDDCDLSTIRRSPY